MRMSQATIALELNGLADSGCGQLDSLAYDSDGDEGFASASEVFGVVVVAHPGGVFGVVAGGEVFVGAGD